MAPPCARVLVLVRGKRADPEGRPEVRLPKGHIEPGESRIQAALREVHEESGLTGLQILSDLGHQQVCFVYQGMQYIRDESYFLMTVPPVAEHEQPEEQFERRWLAWEDALAELTFEAEREWVRRARLKWDAWLEDITDQYAEQPNDNSEVEEEVAIGE